MLNKFIKDLKKIKKLKRNYIINKKKLLDNFIKELKECIDWSLTDYYEEDIANKVLDIIKKYEKK